MPPPSCISPPSPPRSGRSSRSREDGGTPPGSSLAAPPPIGGALAGPGRAAPCPSRPAGAAPAGCPARSGRAPRPRSEASCRKQAGIAGRRPPAGPAGRKPAGGSDVRSSELRGHGHLRGALQRVIRRGKGDPGGGPLADLGRKIEGTMVIPDDGSGDGKAQTQAPGVELGGEERLGEAGPHPPGHSPPPPRGAAPHPCPL